MSRTPRRLATPGWDNHHVQLGLSQASSGTVNSRVSPQGDQNERGVCMSVAKNKAIIRRFVEELYIAANLDVADEIIHPNTRNPRGGQTWENGPESIKKAVTRQHGLLSGIHREIKDIVAEENKVVLYSTISGTHAATGAPIVNTGVATFIIEDGKMVEEPWSCWGWQVTGTIAGAIARRWIEQAYDRGNLDTVDELIGDGYVLHDPHSPGIAGIEGINEHIDHTRTALPDLVHTIEDVIAQGDRVVVRWTARGTHRGGYLGFAPTGKKVTFAGVSIYRLAGGRLPTSIEEEWRVWDPPTALRQASRCSE